MELIFDVGGKKQIVDLAKIAYGHTPRYGLIRINERSCLQVSEIYEIVTPECKCSPKLRKAFVVDINRNAKVNDLHVCYEVLLTKPGSRACLLTTAIISRETRRSSVILFFGTIEPENSRYRGS